MKIARYRHEDEVRFGLVVADGIVPLPVDAGGAFGDTAGLIRQWEDLRTSLVRLARRPAELALDDVALLCPIERPGKILGIGFNYADHRSEFDAPAPEAQLWFLKAGTCANGPFDDIELPCVSEQLDYEAELVVVIGRHCRHADAEAARRAIFGYCAGNDVSVRDWQLMTSQFLLGKSFDSHAPFGPWIATADTIDPSGLDIRCLVNGEVRQSASTRQMIYGVADQIMHVSKVMTLEPGDIIFTGTPAGVGAARKPPAWLVPGDRVRVEISGIGAIENRVVAETPGAASDAREPMR